MKKQSSDTLPNKADKKKLDNLMKLVISLMVARPAMLLLADDNYCWMQFFMLRFLEIDTILLISRKDKKVVKARLPKLTANMWVYYFNNPQHLIEVTNEAINNYTRYFEEEKE